jgi:hypothetical protein
MMLVLGLASAANATLVSLSMDGTNASDGTEDILEDATLTVYCLGDDQSGMEYLDMLKGKATMTMPTEHTNAGDMASVSDYSTGTLYDFELTAADSGGSYVAGIHFVAVITATGNTDDTFKLEILEGTSPYDSIDDIVFTIIPEPMTVALLGLGGLLLRRRK